MASPFQSLIEGLYQIGAVQFGEFRLKSGLLSPIYVDLRLLPSSPVLLKEAARALAHAASTLSFDRVAAIPLGGLPIGTALTLEMERPLIYPRPEVKQHGSKKSVEGAYHAGETALVVDDLISTGGAKLEAVEQLKAEGLLVRDVLVLIDRQQGGREELAAAGLTLHALFTLLDMTAALEAAGSIGSDQAQSVRQYLEGGR